MREPQPMEQVDAEYLAWCEECQTIDEAILMVAAAAKDDPSVMKGLKRELKNG